MRKEPTVGVLIDRFGKDLNTLFYPFFIVTIIARNGSATRQKIWEEIFAITHGAFPCELDSHNRQMSRMEKTFGLIEPSQRKRDTALVSYRLTEKGQRLYSESLTRFIEPLSEVLAHSCTPRESSASPPSDHAK
jgi:DNA-binding PadR family transcriptional regulator